jgi:hypothetical protein
MEVDMASEEYIKSVALAEIAKIIKELTPLTSAEMHGAMSSGQRDARRLMRDLGNRLETRSKKLLALDEEKERALDDLADNVLGEQHRYGSPDQ